MKVDEIVRPCNRHSNESMTLGKHVTKYKNMRKWKVEFLTKFENPGIKIARVNSILITNSMDFQSFTLILHGARCDVDMFKLTVSAQSIYREVYGSTLKRQIKKLAITIIIIRNYIGNAKNKMVERNLTINTKQSNKNSFYYNYKVMFEPYLWHF